MFILHRRVWPLPRGILVHLPVTIDICYQSWIVDSLVGIKALFPALDDSHQIVMNIVLSLNHIWYAEAWDNCITLKNQPKLLYTHKKTGWNCVQLEDHITLMGKCKKDVTPLLRQWSYVFLALTHQYVHTVCSVNVILPLISTTSSASWMLYN